MSSLARPRRIHAALVHFPVACWSIAALIELFVPPARMIALSNISSVDAVVALIYVGVATAGLAIVAGMHEYSSLNKDRKLLRLALIHVLTAISSAACFTGLALAIQLGENWQAAIVARKVLAGSGLALLLIAGHLGSEIVTYRSRNTAPTRPP